MSTESHRDFILYLDRKKKTNKEKEKSVLTGRQYVLKQFLTEFDFVYVI